MVRTAIKNLVSKRSNLIHIVHGSIFRSKILSFIRYDGKKIRKFEIPAILKICMLSVIHGSNRHKKLS